jgi:uncharacterized protein (TIGR03086 family)
MTGMETIAQRYDRLAGAFADKITGADGKWDAPSPCEDWKAIDVVKHVTETPAMFFGLIDKDFGEVPSVESDGPAAAFDATRRRVVAALEDPETATTEFDGMMGRQTFEQSVDRFLSFDLLVHAWDLATATGQESRMAEADVARLEEASKGFGDAMRGPGAFGPEVEAPADADRQAKLLAFLGRRP